MTGMCCVNCQGVRIKLCGPMHVITDSKGRAWRFEEHHYCGPIVLRNDGEPKARQPGSTSAFWTAYEAWRIIVKSPPHPQPAAQERSPDLSLRSGRKGKDDTDQPRHTAQRGA
jgi:hypothetical protein